MAYLGLARKYRPQKFSDLIGQEIVVKILENSLRTNRISHAYVFSGPKGVGKTSTARILAKALNCENSTNRPCDSCPSCISIKEGKSMSVIEIDAASHTSVENIRDLRENVRYASVEGTYKVYIIDEAHMLSQSAFNAFLKTLEEPPSHVVFVLATTEPRKIPLTVMSRCQHLQFRRIPIDLIKERLKFICANEGIKAQDEALYLIAANSEGSMRDALTFLDQLSSFSEDITVENVNTLLGITDIETLASLIEYTLEGNREELVEKIEYLNDSGADFKVLIRDLIFFTRNLLIKRIYPRYTPEIGKAYSETLDRISRNTSEEHLVLILRELINAESHIKLSLFPRIIFEVTLLRLSLLSHFREIKQIISDLKSFMPKNRIESSELVEEKVIQEELVNRKDKVSIEELSKLWLNYLENLQKQNPILAMKVKHADFEFEEGKIKLIYNGGASVYSDSVRELIPELKKQLSSFIPDVEILVLEKENKPKDYKNEALNNPIVKQTLQLFEGRIYNIKPKTGGKENV